MNKLPSELAGRRLWPRSLWLAGRREMIELVLVRRGRSSRIGIAHIACFPKRNWLNTHDAKNMIAQQGTLILSLLCFRLELLTKTFGATRNRFTSPGVDTDEHGRRQSNTCAEP